MQAKSGYWYLATPYSGFTGDGPGGPMMTAFREAAKVAGIFIRAGVPVFSPIAHSHPIGALGSFDSGDHEVWLAADMPLLEAAVGVIVVKMPGWDTSKGVREEIEFARIAGKPVLFMDWGGEE